MTEQGPTIRATITALRGRLRLPPLPPVPEPVRRVATPAAIVLLTLGALAFAMLAEDYASFVLALVALTVVVCVGLNILLGLGGQVSLGHVGFYAIGAYAVAILTLAGVNFWIALPLAGVIAAAVGVLLSLPALRVAGPTLAMLTIAFAFIVQHGTIEWRALTGGANGLMGLPPPAIGSLVGPDFHNLRVSCRVMMRSTDYPF
ncbi:branched-chain amino acid ABC transporter permease, partial [Rhodoplanes roseus]